MAIMMMMMIMSIVGANGWYRRNGDPLLQEGVWPGVFHTGLNKKGDGKNTMQHEICKSVGRLQDYEFTSPVPHSSSPTKIVHDYGSYRKFHFVEHLGGTPYIRVLQW
mmetsp:Transcript_126074/g.247179  ORF Transcript_126074/g.247179 Transcript_126074/m.247179 type:complete len:107 (-) Transcript_126074:13-333(-)